MNMSIQISLQDRAFNSVGYIPRNGLLNHMVIAFNFFCGTAIPFSIMTAPFYIPNSNAQGLQFPHILTNTYFILFFIVTIRKCC